MIRRFVSLIVLVLCLVIGNTVYAGDIPVVIFDPGSSCDAGTYDPSNICTIEPSIKLCGSAGVKITPTGTAVNSINFKNYDSLRSGNMSIDVTTAATRVYIQGCAFGTPDDDLSADTITINGVTIQGGHTVTATVSNINQYTSLTGVNAMLDGGMHIVLTYKEYGSSHHINISGGNIILGPSYLRRTVRGVDVIARVDYVEYAEYEGYTYPVYTSVTDNIWNHGNGCTIMDT